DSARAARAPPTRKVRRIIGHLDSPSPCYRAEDDPPCFFATFARFAFAVGFREVLVKWPHGDESTGRVVEVHMKRLGAILLAVLSIVVALPAAQPAVGPDVRLVLLIAVDQFRYDYLTRFRAEYSSGIKRLLDD